MPPTGWVSCRAALSVTALSSINFLDSYCRYLISVSLLPYLNYASYEYGLLSGAVFGVVCAAVGVAMSLHPFVTKHAVAALSVATILFSGAFMCTALTSSFAQLALIRAAMGVGQAVVLPCGTSILSGLFPSESRGAVFGVFNLSVYASFAAALSLGTYMYDELGWRAGYLLFGAIGCLVGIAVPCIVTPGRAGRRSGSAESDRESLLNGFREISAADESEFLDSLHSSEAAAAAADDSPGSEKRVAASGKREGGTGPVHVSVSSLVRALVRLWRLHPSIPLLCLAMGVRLGGGYIWSSYTAAFFSELFVDDGESCEYTYSAAFATAAHACGPDRPICVSGLCRDIAQTPWHNTGMSHERLERFMSWVPLAGSGMGSVLGGFLSDWSTKTRLSLVHGRLSVPQTANRALLAAISCLLSAPVVMLAVRAGFPNCFAILTVSGLLGEMYLGITLTLLSDLSPPPLLALCTAVAMLAGTAVASTVQLLVPLLKGIFDERNGGHTFSIEASPPAGSSEDAQYTYLATRTGAAGLQQAMFLSLGGVYLLSALLFALSFLQLRSELAVVESSRSGTSALSGEAGSGSW